MMPTPRGLIEDAIARHNVGRDQRDAQMLASVYLDDATVQFGPDPMPAREWIDHVCTAPTTLRSLHRTYNLMLVADGDQARSETYCIARVELPDQGMLRYLGGRYLDRLERHSGRWGIRSRCFLFDWNIDVPPGKDEISSRLPVRSNAAPLTAEQADLANLLHGEVRSIDRGQAPLLVGGIAPTAVTMSFHALGEPGFDIRDDLASLTCDLFAVVKAGRDIMVTGRLAAQARRVDGAWAITGLEFAETWRGERPVSTVSLPFEPGRRDRSDPVFAFWQ